MNKKQVAVQDPPPALQDLQTLLTIEDVARYLKVSRPKAFEMASAGIYFKVIRIGERNLRVHPDDLKAYIDQLRQKAV